MTPGLLFGSSHIHADCYCTLRGFLVTASLKFIIVTATLFCIEKAVKIYIGAVVRLSMKKVVLYVKVEVHKKKAIQRSCFFFLLKESWNLKN